jgi:NAD+ synthase (glutamine-hydrolysing)
MGALPPLKECLGYVEVYQDGSMSLVDGPWLKEQEDPTLSEVLVYGTKMFLQSCGIHKVVIGLSGGIDSALSTLIHVKALGPENVVLVNMPTEYNSETTKGIAADIAKNLGCPYMVVPIGDLCRRLESTITNPFKDVYKDAGGMGFVREDKTHPLYAVNNAYKVDSENIAARMRGAGIQAALAAGLKAVFPNNGNKSELTVGYCTLYGDVGGYMAPLADLWKYEVYEVAKQLSDEMGGILPEAIFTLKPSAELSADHNVEEGKGDPLVYWYHDKLLASWMEPWSRRGIEGTLQDFKDGKLLLNLGLQEYAPQFIQMFPTTLDFIKDAERWWTQFNQSVFKRVQAPPVLVVSRRAYGFDFRESMGGVAYTLNYLRLKELLLQERK